jgi:hypothetical protein
MRKELMSRSNNQQVFGWIAVIVSTMLTSFWAAWGVLENFHEGWYEPSLLRNLALMVAQYLAPMLGFLIVALVSVRWPRIGAVLHWALASFAFWFFGANFSVALFIITPLALLGLCFWFGRARPRQWAIRVVIGLPLLTLVVCTIEPVWRVCDRGNDSDFGARIVEGNGVKLVWAPAGPGWPLQIGAEREDKMMIWTEAAQRCRHLNEDGLTLADNQQNIWRLPTVDEAVRSMTRHGQNAGGVWDTQKAVATYQIRPDKETPLWRPDSQVIYWWTATEIDVDRAYMISYNGGVFPRAKLHAPTYFTFRCVKPLKPEMTLQTN